MIRILHVMGSLDVGGVEISLLSALENMDRQRFRTTVYCLQSGDTLAERYRAAGATVVFSPHDGNPFRTCLQLRRYLQEHPTDVLHSHVLFFSGWILWTAARQGVRLRIAQAHSTGDRRKSRFIQPLYHRFMRRLFNATAHRRLAVSQAAGTYLFGAGPTASGAVDILPPGIDSRKFRPLPKDRQLQRELGIADNVRIVGHVGSLRPVKNHTFLLETAAGMLARNTDLHFVLVGDGPLREDLRKQAHDLGIAHRVTFTGVRMDVPRFMAALFDMMLFPSLYEGLGNAVLQAQCAGIPVLAADSLPREIAVVPELLDRLSLAAGADAWATRALEILDREPVDRQEANRRVSDSPFDIRQVARQLESLYSGKVTE